MKATELESRAAELREIISRPSDKERAEAELAEVEAQIAEAQEEGAKAEAEKRLTGIARAHGSLRTERAKDLEKLHEAKEAYEAAAARVNERSRRLWELEKEARALTHRFGLEAPALVAASEVLFAAPEVRPAELRTIKPHTEEDEHGFRSRRTYKEVRGSDAYKIIMAAGLKPWPPLTPEQEARLAALESKEEHDARVATDPDLLREIEIVRAIPPNMPASVGVRRG